MASSNRSIDSFIEKVFSTKTYNMQGGKLVTFSRLIVPQSCLGIYNGNYVFYGPDSFFSEELGKFLNATVVIETDVGIEYPFYTDWFKKPTSRFKKFLLYHKEIAPKNFVSNFNHRFVKTRL